MRLSEGECLAIERGRLAGMAEAKTEGKAEGKAETLSRQPTRRFGPLPEWVAPQLQSTSTLDPPPFKAPRTPPSR
jgi:hypothetical protein